ncbi:MAG TPA: sulfatase, partial [Lachnoclostridium sp.]|nr:sulfatase [Lachnoclostridium sp.]
MKLYVKWLGRLFTLSAMINVFIELASRKSLTSLGSYIWRSFPVFILNTLIIALPFTVIFVTKRKAFACITIALI